MAMDPRIRALQLSDPEMQRVAQCARTLRKYHRHVQELVTTDVNPRHMMRHMPTAIQGLRTLHISLRHYSFMEWWPLLTRFPDLETVEFHGRVWVHDVNDLDLELTEDAPIQMQVLRLKDAKLSPHDVETLRTVLRDPGRFPRFLQLEIS